MALAAVAALDDNVKNWLVYWRREGMPETTSKVIGEIGHTEPPTYTECAEYLARDATAGTITCVPLDGNGNVLHTSARVEWPIARRAPEVAPPAQTQQQPDLEKLLAGLGQHIANAIAPLAQRLNELEQRGAASQMPVANAMGMGMDPFTVKLLDRLLVPPAPPPPPPPRSALEDRLLEMAFANLSQPQKVDRVAQMTDTLMQLRMQRELKNEMRALSEDGTDEKEDDKDEEKGVDMMGIAREAMAMIGNRGQQQQPQQTQQAQQLAGPTNIFDSPEALEAAIIADPDRAMMAMKALASKNPTISKLARQTLREGENEGAK